MCANTILKLFFINGFFLLCLATGFLFLYTISIEHIHRIFARKPLKVPGIKTTKFKPVDLLL